MRSIHALWMPERWNSVLEQYDSAHAECWMYRERGIGVLVGDLEGWTEQDCDEWQRYVMRAKSAA